MSKLGAGTGNETTAKRLCKVLETSGSAGDADVGEVLSGYDFGADDNGDENDDDVAMSDADEGDRKDQKQQEQHQTNELFQLLEMDRKLKF